MRPRLEVGSEAGRGRRSERPMRIDHLEYRAYSVDDDGHIAHSNVFVAANDDAAFEHARQFVNGHDVELWSRDRLVARLKNIRPSKLVGHE